MMKEAHTISFQNASETLKNSLKFVRKRYLFHHSSFIIELNYYCLFIVEKQGRLKKGQARKVRKFALFFNY